MVENGARAGEGRTVLISGASGFVGRFVCDYLTKRQWMVKRLVRRAPRSDNEVGWDPERLRIDDGALTDVFGVVHLAGESVAGRWTEAKKSRIVSSRVNGTRTLAQAIRTAPSPPQVFVSASAIGYYGDRGDEILTEESAPHHDFLGNACVAWEEESKVVDDVCRRVNPRIGIVFGPDGGALEQMVRPIRWGVGGKLGSGQQWVSWVSLMDLARLFEWCLTDVRVVGALNAVSPEPVTNAELTHRIADLVHRPSVLTVPKLALKLVLGEFSSEVLSSKRVSPAVARKLGFEWCHTSVAEGLRWSLKVGASG